ncbi:MAG TPA: hypothetical protein VFS68_10045, partial [Candidatus Udaeobacter sp.]|nr:hypothetical protein [Candidatus Udaeobacter sp.]
MILQLCDDRRVVVRIEKRQRQIKPSPVGGQGQYIQKEHDQVVCVSRFGGQRFFMHNFEINQSRPAARLVIKHIVRARISM